MDIEADDSASHILRAVTSDGSRAMGGSVREVAILMPHLSTQTITRSPRATLAVALLVLTLALAGCGGRGAHQSSSNGNQGSVLTSQQSSQGSAQGASQQVQGSDQQVQAILSVLDSAQNDADTDYSAQDTSTQP